MSHIGIQSGTITTIHSAMNDQPVVRCLSPHGSAQDPRGWSQSIIPVDTELARGIERMLAGNLEGKFTAQALRVPTLECFRNGFNRAGRLAMLPMYAQVNRDSCAAGSTDNDF